MRVGHEFYRKEGDYASLHGIQDSRLDKLTDIGREPFIESFYAVGNNQILKLVQLKRGEVNFEEDPIETYAGDCTNFGYDFRHGWFWKNVDTTRQIRSTTGSGPVIIDAWVADPAHVKLTYYNSTSSASVDDQVGFILYERPAGVPLQDDKDIVDHYEQVVDKLSVVLASIVEKTDLFPYCIDVWNIYIHQDTLDISFLDFDGISDDPSRFDDYQKDVFMCIAKLRAKYMVAKRLRKRSKK